MADDHEHCWHMDGMFGNTAKETCCHCGLVTRARYENVRDPAHGDHVPAYRLRLVERGPYPTGWRTVAGNVMQETFD